MDLSAIFHQFAQTTGPAAVAELWQGALLATGLSVCLRFVPGIAAADRFRAWAAGLAALVALPFLPFVTAIHFGSASAMRATAVAAPAHAWLEFDSRWALAIAALWVAASTWRAIDLSVHALRLRKVWKRAEPVETASTELEVCVTHELDRPSVIGFLRPRILIPAWLFARLSAEELDHVLLHEAEHLKRRDDWTNLLQKLALVAFPLNPALAWMEGRLCQEREMACDDAVVQATGKPRAYAACLASLAERGLERRIERQREALSLGAWRQRPELVGRVHRILKNAPHLNPLATRALLAAVGCGLLAGSVEFARAPQLVKFVAAPVVAQSSVPDLVNAGMRRDTIPGYSAVNAIARIPSRAAVASEPHMQQQKTSVPKTAESGTDDARTNAARTNGLVETADVTKQGNGQNQQQWIVLTTWEQVVAVNRNGNVVADYDMDDANASQDTGKRADAAAQPAAGQWTVTQLILRIDPAGQNAGASQVKPDAAPDSNSQPALPAAIPLRDGWLVFQL